MSPYCAHIYAFTWQTMLPKKVFNFIARKSHFPFCECRNGSFFVMYVPRIRFKMVPHHFFKMLDHILSIIHQPVESKSFLASSRKKRQVSADLARTLPNLNYKCFVICSRFFIKIIFRYTTCGLIRDTMIVWQDSTSR